MDINLWVYNDQSKIDMLKPFYRHIVEIPFNSARYATGDNAI